MSEEQQNVVLSADVSNYTQGMQTAYQETNRLNQGIAALSNSVDKLYRTGKQSFTIISASATAGLIAAQASAAKLEDTMSQLEARSVVTGQKTNSYAQSVSNLRREFGMAAESAVQLVTAMNTMGARNPQQAQQLAQNYVRLSTVTGESVTGLANEQNQFIRTMNSGRLNTNNLNNYSAMTSGLSQNAGVSATDTLQFANSIAPLAKTTGMNQQQIMGFATTFAQAGQDGGGASTAMNRILQDMSYAKQYGGPQTRRYAGFLGMDTDQFKQLGTSEALNRIFDKTAADPNAGAKFWNSIGMDGVRTQKAVQAVSQSGQLRDNIAEASRSYDNTSNFEEAASKSLQGLNAEGQKLAETFKMSAQSIGGVFIPGLTSAAETLNTLLTPLQKFSDMLNAIPDPVKSAVGLGMTGLTAARVTRFVAPKMGSLLMGSAGMSTLKTGAGAIGFQHARNPGMGSTENLEALLGGEAGAVNQAMFKIGGILGGLTPKGRAAANPAVDADTKKSEAARKAEAEATKRQQAKTEAEAKAKAEETFKQQSSVNVNGRTISQAAVMGDLATGINELKDVTATGVEQSKKAATDNLKVFKDFKMPTKEQIADAGKGGVRWGVETIGQMRSAGLDALAHPNDHMLRNRGSRMIGSKNGSDLLNNLALSLGGLEDYEDGPKSLRQRIGSKILNRGGTDRTDLARLSLAEVRDMRAESKIEFKPGASLTGSALKYGTDYAKDYASGIVGIGKAAAPVLGNLAMNIAGGPVGLGMLGIGAATYGIGKLQESDEYSKSLLEMKDGDFQAPTQIYADALGEATKAVKDFAQGIRENTLGDPSPKTVEDALKITDSDRSYSGKEEMISSGAKEVVGKLNTKSAQSYAEMVIGSAGSPGQIQAAKLDLIAKFGADEAEGIWSRAIKVNEDAAANGTVSASGFGMANHYRGNNDESKMMLGMGAQDFRDTYQRINDLHGKNQAGGYAYQTLQSILNDDGMMPSNLFGPTQDKLLTLLSASGIAGDKLGSAKERLETATGTAGTTLYNDNQSPAERREWLTKQFLEIVRDSGATTQYNPLGGGFAPDMSKGRVYNNQDYILDALNKAGMGEGVIAKLLASGDDQGKKFSLAASQPGDESLMYQQSRALASFIQRATSSKGNSGVELYNLSEKQLAEFTANLADVDPGASELGAQALQEIQARRSKYMQSQGHTDIISTGQQSLASYQQAQQLYNANQNPTTLGFMTTNKQALEQSMGSIDTFVQGVAKQFTNLERSFGYAREDMEWNNSYSRERFDIQVGRTNTQRNRQLAWQEDDYQRSRDYQSEDYNRSRKYQEEDFNRSRKYGEDDYDRSRVRNQENYDRMRLRSQESFQRQLTRGDRDWNISRGRQLVDYNRSRKREEEDYNHQIERMAKSTAQNILNIYSRISVERTWTASNLIENFADQQRQLAEQVSNLGKLRKMGMTDDAIENLGLADSNKAQQLARLVEDLKQSPAQLKEINKAVEDRIAVTGKLIKDPSNSSFAESEYQRDKNLKRQEEDFYRSLDRAEKDRKRSLADSKEDFLRSMSEQEEDRRIFLAQQAYDFSISMSRSLEQFQLSNTRSNEEFNRSRSRTDADHKRSLSRSNTLFKESMAHQREDFEESLRRQAEALERSQSNAKKRLSDDLEIITKSTSDSFTELNKILSGKTAEQFKTLQTLYSDMSKLVGQLKGEVQKTWHELNPQMPGTSGRLDPKVHKSIGGPEMHSDEGHAEMLGAGTNSSGSGSASPATGTLSQGFHSKHPGIDVAGSIGSPVRAAMGGTVAYSGNAGAYGNFTKIAHGDGLETWYGHQSMMNVSKGDIVDAGQIIGSIGDTGRSTGPHLHFEARENGRAVNPSSFFGSHTEGDGATGGPLIDDVLKKHDFKNNKAFTQWEDGIDRTPYRSKIKRGDTAKYWEDKLRDMWVALNPAEVFTTALGVGITPGSIYKMVKAAGSGKVKVRGKYMDAASYAILQAVEKASGLRFNITQGSFEAASAGSGTTHTGAGVIDIAQYDNAHIGALQRFGAAAWPRGPQEKYRNHGHVVFPVPGVNANAVWQYKDFWQKGGSGLRGVKYRGPSGVSMIDPSVASFMGISAVAGATGAVAAAAGAGAAYGDSSTPIPYNGKTVRPVPGAGSGWNGGRYRKGGYHGGVDFPNPTGTPVKAMWDGIVEYVRHMTTSYGKHVKMRHPNGLDTLYAHMSQTLTSTGAKVGAGQVIGRVGDTGNSFGSHLHLELRPRGAGHNSARNPMPYLSGAGYASGIGNSAGGIKQVGEHGIELIIGRTARKFLGGEMVLNNSQTRQAFNRGHQGYAPVNTYHNAGASNHYDHSMNVQQVIVQTNDPNDFRNKMEDKRRLTALVRG